MRINWNDLDQQAKRINELTGNSTEYSTEIAGKRVFNGGHYHIDGAYGGVKLVQLCEGNTSGIRDISQNGYVPKKELYNWMNAFIDGIYIEKKANEAEEE